MEKVVVAINIVDVTKEIYDLINRQKGIPVAECCGQIWRGWALKNPTNQFCPTCGKKMACYKQI